MRGPFFPNVEIYIVNLSPLVLGFSGKNASPVTLAKNFKLQPIHHLQNNLSTT